LLLLLMDRDQNGKVSKEEFMNFMAAEFERLDKNKDGELDVNELTQSRNPGSWGDTSIIFSPRRCTARRLWSNGK
jgi:Ca2+-binding EF-hand superfamily protein